MTPLQTRSSRCRTAPLPPRTRLPAGINLTIANLTIQKLAPSVFLPSPWGFLDGAINLAVEAALRATVTSEIPKLIDSLVPPLIDPLLHNLSSWLGENYPPQPIPEPPPPLTAKSGDMKHAKPSAADGPPQKLQRCSSQRRRSSSIGATCPTRCALSAI